MNELCLICTPIYQTRHCDVGCQLLLGLRAVWGHARFPVLLNLNMMLM